MIWEDSVAVYLSLTLNESRWSNFLWQSYPALNFLSRTASMSSVSQLQGLRCPQPINPHPSTPQPVNPVTWTSCSTRSLASCRATWRWPKAQKRRKKKKLVKSQGKNAHPHHLRMEGSSSCNTPPKKKQQTNHTKNRREASPPMSSHQLLTRGQAGVTVSIYII